MQAARTGLRIATLRAAVVALAVLAPATTFSAPAGEEPDPLLLEKLAATMASSSGAVDRFDAEVWLKASDQRLQRFVSDADERLPILRVAYREAHAKRLDPDLVMAVMQVESAFDRFAISSVGAQGLMQVMPFWRLEIGRPQDNLTDLETNIRYGTTILAHYIEVSKGDLVEALGRYNGSRGQLRYPERVVAAWRTRWRSAVQSEVPQLHASCNEYMLKACRY